jgi:antitoxin (DNA-binding transcriptional repressor) of toxin-antitoxin stability system
MTELLVSASDFRVHLKDLANDVAAGRERVVMARHGHPMVALVSQQDLNFLRRHKPAIGATDNCTSDGNGAPDSVGRPAAAAEEISPPDLIAIPPDDDALALQARRHPDTMETADIERLYAATKQAGHIDAVWWWRLNAYTVLGLRGRRPAELPM